MGCYYNHRWITWIPQKIARVFPYCETPQGKYYAEEVAEVVIIRVLRELKQEMGSDVLLALDSFLFKAL